MKRLLLLFAMTVITSIVVNAQCTPDPQYTTPGVYPDSAAGFADVCVDSLYEQLITNVIPIDTVVMVGSVPITLIFDSVIITSFTGLPPGFTYTCFDGQNVTSPMDQCAFEGGTTGCVIITGTPSAGDEGIYNLNIITEAYLGGQSTPQATIDIDYYSIEVFPSGSCVVGVEENSKSKFKLFPNPVAESFTLDGLEGLNVSTISISNTEGKILNYFNDINSSSSSFDMNVADLEGGIYFVRIAHGSSVDIVRFIKE